MCSEIKQRDSFDYEDKEENQPVNKTEFNVVIAPIKTGFETT